MNSKLSLSVLALSVGVLGGCASISGVLDGEDEVPVFVIDDQARGDTLEIAAVTLVQPGYVVVHDSTGGQPGAVLGHSELLDAGMHENVTIALDSSGEGEGLWPMLHSDDGNGSYEFPGPDAPVVVDGTPVMTLVTWEE